MEKCTAKHIGDWTGTTYTCSLFGDTHSNHVDNVNTFIWFNYEKYCGNVHVLNINDFCKRPPNHSGPCRIKVGKNTIRFKAAKVIS